MVGWRRKTQEAAGSEPARCRTGEELVRKSHGHQSHTAGFRPAAGLKSGDRHVYPGGGTFGAESSDSQGSGSECSSIESVETRPAGREAF